MISATINGDGENIKRDSQSKELEKAVLSEEIIHDSPNADNKVDIDLEQASKKYEHHVCPSDVAASTGQN